jgi:hypothetical protein
MPINLSHKLAFRSILQLREVTRLGVDMTFDLVILGGKLF